MAAQFGASSSSPTTQSAGTYDVFLSFRGSDTRNNFVGHLYYNLVQKGIKTFRDDDELEGGQEIASTLIKAIEESKIFVVVFSKTYATSKWCLDELVKIIDCKNLNHQIVCYPVFYKVDPSEVRYQKGSFAEAFAKHELRYSSEVVGRWKIALTQAANVSGQHFTDGGHEANFMETIVGEISAKLLDFMHLEVAEYPVGLESRVEDMLNLLRVGENDVHMVGIWGKGGIGKTTIAKAVYNQIAHKFDSTCFLKNVKDAYGGLRQLQDLLLSKMLGKGTLKVTNDDEGAEIIKTRLKGKKVLIVVDDVNDTNQLKKLVGGSDWFKSGSRIIITTRDMHFLTGHKVNDIYEVKELNHNDALELLRLNAFEGNIIHDKETLAVIDDVLNYSKGLPLALVVTGSLLRNKSRNQWKAAIKSLQKSGKGIRELLEISYHALVDDEKEVFLHISCFFKGKNKNYVTDILEGCDLNPEDSIEVLRKMALISITEEGDIWMHDLLEDMGKNIVIRESPEPGERSRLWRYEDVYHVFVENTGTHKVKSIVVNDIKVDGIVQRQQIPLSSESFLKFKNLQILLICREVFNEYDACVDYFPNELRILDWVGCPLRNFPSTFYPRNLGVLKMDFILMSSTSRQSEIAIAPILGTSSPRTRLQMMNNLKTIELVACKGLTKISDLFRFPNLINLKVNSCGSLDEVSVGVLKNLVNLDLSGNGVLGKFEIAEEMKSLKRLNLTGTAIKELSSSSIGYLINLEELVLLSCKNLTDVPCSIFELQHLQHLNLSYCINLVTFPTESESSWRRSLHDKYYDPLSVNVGQCKGLVEVSEFAREIDGLDTSSCPLLRRVSKLCNILEGKETKMWPRTNLYRCYLLCDNLASEVAKMKKNLPDDSAVTALLSLFLSCRQSGFEVSFPGSKFPEWFTCSTGFERFQWPKDVNITGIQVYKFKIKFPENFNWENKGLAFCTHSDLHSVFTSSYFRFRAIYINGVCIESKMGDDEYALWRVWRGHVWLYYIPFHIIITRLGESRLPPPSMCEVDFKFKYQTVQNFGWLSDHDKAWMGSCGVHVVMLEDEGVFVNGHVHHVYNEGSCLEDQL